MFCDCNKCKEFISGQSGAKQGRVAVVIVSDKAQFGFNIFDFAPFCRYLGPSRKIQSFRHRICHKSTVTQWADLCGQIEYGNCLRSLDLGKTGPVFYRCAKKRS